MEQNDQYFDHMNEAAPSGAPRKERGAAGGIFVVGMILGVAISLLIVGIVYVAFSFQKVSDKQQETVSFQENSVITPESVKKLQALETTINKYFFLDKADNETLQEGLYKGLLSALDDPYTEYYSAEELEELMQDTEGIYFGIGAYVGLDSLTSLPKISGVIGNSPAEEADLRPNDLVYEVDGTSTYGLTLTEAVNLIRGPEGTQVELTIVREGAGDYLHVTLTRRKVETPTVEYEMLDEFTPSNMNVIGPLEHERWRQEKLSMGWQLDDAYLNMENNKEVRELTRTHSLMVEEYGELDATEQAKDTEPMNYMLRLIEEFDGLRIYRT